LFYIREGVIRALLVMTEFPPMDDLPPWYSGVC